jgi:hypothetical protein
MVFAKAKDGERLALWQRYPLLHPHVVRQDQGCISATLIFRAGSLWHQRHNDIQDGTSAILIFRTLPRLDRRPAETNAVPARHSFPRANIGGTSAANLPRRIKTAPARL